MNNRPEVIKSIYTGFVDGEAISLEKYRPKLIVNNHLKGEKVLSSIISELKNCDEFFISVAFVTQSGITTILNTLQELEKRNIKGKIVTSQYLNFTEPKALKKLLDFKNIELRIVSDGNLHSKGYMFKKDDTYSLIVGSSNLTQHALSYNKEWNMKISSMEQGSLIQETLVEFEETFKNANVVNLQWINEYSKIYSADKDFQSYIKSQRDKTSRYIDEEVAEGESEYGCFKKMLEKIMPNKMQLNALQGIEAVRSQGENKALLISATGTGKTYLSAFDVKKVKPKKFLFLAHREQILDQSIESYKKILGENISYGKLCNGFKDIDANYLFSTVQSMSKESVLEVFSRNEFDYIVIDETHRAGADTYQRILNYFRPEFLLGMTATPERTDEYNICKDFDYNIAYEIRLQEALQENMLCPFHYFGITEISVDGILIEENTDFKYLVSEQRVDNIIEKIEFYGYHGDRVKGLVFCSNNNEAKELSEKFNQRGYQTLALSGADSREKREYAIKLLEQKERETGLDYIFTVDIFNEGIDIPVLNQIIMLRPTQSAIIFVQQLGRGLRKIPSKEYVVILDFIGNYSNNFLIPMALSDDRTYNKDNIRRYIVEGSRIIPGASTINFDEISKQKIYESIDNAKFNSIQYIKESYINLKYRLGHIPNLMDFEIHNAIDLERIFDNKALGSYHEFLIKYEKEDYNIELNRLERLFVQFISKKFAVGKRVHELVVLKGIIEGEIDVLGFMKKTLIEEYNIKVEEKTMINVVNVLMGEFATGTGKETFSECIFIKEQNELENKGEMQSKIYIVSDSFKQALENQEFKDMLIELIEFGIYRNSKYFGNRYKTTNLQLYQKYSYEDVCWLLEWEQNVVAQNIGGYKYDESTQTFPVFINYNKSEDINHSINYEDRFISRSKLIALSKSNRTIESKDVKTIYSAKNLGINIELFVRKNKDDKISKEFYYLGRINAVSEPRPVIMKNTQTKAVEITYQLETAVREDIYEYLIE